MSNENGAASPAAAGEAGQTVIPVQVGVQGPQLVASAELLIRSQTDALIKIGVPAEVVIDLYLKLVTNLIARIDSHTLRAEIADRIAQAFPKLVGMQEVAVRTTTGGVVLPRGAVIPGG